MRIAVVNFVSGNVFIECPTWSSLLCHKPAKTQQCVVYNVEILSAAPIVYLNVSIGMSLINDFSAQEIFDHE